MYESKNIIIYIISLNLALLSFLSFSHGASADKFPARPENVPQDYIVTPSGYFHPSCVHEVKNDEIINPELIVEKLNGEKRKIEECNYSNFSRLGKERVIENNSHPKTNFIDGWQLYASYTIPKSLGALLVEWNVPENPGVSDGQTLFFFPGVEQRSEISILQPVLGWNQLNRTGWTLASWNCCEQGTIYHSTPVKTNANDLNIGKIVFDKNLNGYRVQGFANNYTSQLKTRNYPLVDWVFGGAMENYGVRSCDGLPTNGSIKFKNIYVLDKENNGFDIKFKPTVNHSACNYGISVDNNINSPNPSVELKW